MALYKQEKAPVNLNVPCYTGYAMADKVMLHERGACCPIELGVKRFHCLRRFTLDAIPKKCDNCMRDMNERCFFLHKQYYSVELVTLLVKVYAENAKLKIGDSHIWDFNKYFSSIMTAIRNPNQMPTPGTDYMTEWENKHETEF